MTDNDKQQTTPAAGDTGTVPGQQTGQTPAEKMIAESQVNHIIAQRVAETKQSVEASIRAQYADYETIKGAAAKWKEFEDSQKTELEKIQSTFETERNNWNTEKSALEKKAQLAASTATELAFIKKAVKDAGLTLDRAEAAYKLLDPSKLKFNDKGEVENAAEQVKALVEEYPFLKTPDAPPPQGKTNAAIKPTNPAGGKTGPDLSWFKPAGRGGAPFTSGGVRPPQGDE